MYEDFVRSPIHQKQLAEDDDWLLLVSSDHQKKARFAVVTGGARGIGESTARLFIRHGAKVVLADVQDDLGRAICEDIANDEVVSYIHRDVSCESDVENAVNTAMAKHGKQDIMFGNAGSTGKGVNFTRQHGHYIFH
ncbi:unnamed protein product [Ilex paraguariensis]|uniref:Uncharacterized protein n=1 Tax=Ilex paraguariensis TaxID=185542 RepID=A0ABC8UID8_9AQUA